MDARRMTCVIVRRDGEYLVGRIIGTDRLRWSTSPYDARGTRDRKSAEAIAERLGGELMLFNPIGGQLRRLAE